MRVISIRLLKTFWERHADAEGPLKAWYKTTRKADWKNLKEVRETYSKADGVSSLRGEILTVFNIGGHKYRLITRIRYDWGLINIRYVLTHREYDREKW